MTDGGSLQTECQTLEHSVIPGLTEARVIDLSVLRYSSWYDKQDQGDRMPAAKVQIQDKIRFE